MIQIQGQRNLLPINSELEGYPKLFISGKLLMNEDKGYMFVEYTIVRSHG